MYGVVDNNVFDDFSYALRNTNTAYGNDWWRAAASPGFGWTLGDRYKLYFEDNIFNFGSGWFSNGASNSQFSGRYAFRYNTFNVQQQAYSLFDVHGIQSETSGGMFACFGAEMYGNSVFQQGRGGTFIELRSGSSVVFYNQVSSFGLETSSSQVICPTTIEMESQMVTNTYFWQNRTGNTGPLVYAKNDDSGIGCNGRTRPSRGQDFFDNGSSPGVGCGPLAARPSACTVGQGYWATTQSCIDLTGATGANPATPIQGTLYVCSAANSWSTFFTPYTYPHPLRGNDPPSGSAPRAPTNLSVLAGQ